MKKLICILVIVMFLVVGCAKCQSGFLGLISSGSGGNTPPTTLAYNPDLIELAGQSNAAGAAASSGFASDLQSAITGAYIFYNQNNTYSTYTWQTLQLGVNNKGNFLNTSGGANGASGGVECRLMKLLRAYYGRDQYLLKTAVSGTLLQQTSSTSESPNGVDWSQNSSNELFDQSNAYNVAGRNLLSNTKPPRAIIWIQGEQDNWLYPNNYQTNLTNFIAAKRTAYGYNVPFVIVRLGNMQTWQNTSVVRAAQAAVAGQANNYLVDADGLACQADNLHYTAASYETLAQRIYNVLIALPQ